MQTKQEGEPFEQSVLGVLSPPFAFFLQGRQRSGTAVYHPESSSQLVSNTSDVGPDKSQNSEITSNRLNRPVFQPQFPPFVIPQFIHCNPDDLCYFPITLFRQNNSTGIRQCSCITTSFFMATMNITLSPS